MVVSASFRKYTLLVVILIVAALLRLNTFWLPHISDDAYYITAVALKLDADGLAGYNLWGIDFEEFTLDGKHTIHEIRRSPAGERGKLLHGMHPEMQEVYSRPLYHTPPALPWLIKLSQRWIGGSNGYFLSSSNIGQKHLTDRPADIFRAQLYVTVIPFIFSLLMIWLVYLLARRLFNAPTALIAAALMAINPVSMLAAQRIWSEEASMVFMLLSGLLFVQCLPFATKKAHTNEILPDTTDRSLPRKSVNTALDSPRIRYLFGFLAGLAAGIAYLFKPTAAIWPLVVLLFYLWQQRGHFRTLTGLKLLLLNRLLWLFALGFLATTAWWFLAVWSQYGNPIFYPFPNTINLAGQGYFDLLEQRPHALILFSIGLMAISPYFLLIFVSFNKSVHSKLSKKKQFAFPLLTIWIVTWFLIMAFLFQGKEHRFMLPAYPAMAMLAAWAINLFREWSLPYTKHWRWLGTNELLFVVFIIIARYTSITMAEVINSGAVLILKPF